MSLRTGPHRILVLDHYAGTLDHGMEYRPFYFGREWVRSGHRVLVIAAGYSHLRRVNPEFPGATQSECHEGVNYLWVQTPPYHGNGIGRVRNMVEFMLRVRMQCAGAVAAFRPDLVIASSTYTWDNWLASHFARAHQATYVYEVHDLWPLSPMELGNLSRYHPFVWTLQLAEDFACRHADRVVSLLPAARSHLVDHGMPPDRFVHIPNGIDTAEWTSPEPVPTTHADAIRSARAEGAFLVGYVGSHGLSNALDTLVDAAASPDTNGIRFICVGDGPEKPRLEAKSRDLGSRVTFLRSVPKRSVPSLLSEFDALYLGWARSPLYRFGISPNKLFEYMMAGAPVIHAVEAANDPVRDSGCGYSVAPGSAPELCRSLRTLAALPLVQRRAIGQRGREYVLRHHDVHVLAAHFLDRVLREEAAPDEP